MLAAHGHEHEHACSARRRRGRRLRSWWRHEQFAIRCAVASATDHSARRPRHVDAEAQTNIEQTVEKPVPQGTEQTVHEYNPFREISK